MRLIGREKLLCLKDAGEQVEKWIISWISELSDAQWKYPLDVINQFPKANHVEGGLFVFYVGHCKWVIDLVIAFPQGIAVIASLRDEGCK